jgi:hypothetical protein
VAEHYADSPGDVNVVGRDGTQRRGGAEENAEEFIDWRCTSLEGFIEVG